MKSLSTFLALALTLSLAFASDPSPLQDFCIGVSDPADGLYVNGKFCKDPNLAILSDFVITGLNERRPINDPIGSNVTFVNVDNLPGLNTLGLAFARADFEVNGQILPHTHPRASEILFVTEGSILAGFVTADDTGNRVFSKVLNKGDLIVFPLGMVHHAVNVGKGPAVAFGILNSQNPGMITIANTKVLGSNLQDFLASVV
ncbi:hypothetical protein AALP_AA4G068500 [Arabis alpina]|uniref:Germin-like protein n=1 Tax=Arabis alpina TaxID=50452 RepID=A0A087H1M7_ARAAL|nr:hypothetical protein AALP_AA4G068500 [Arabis alpina]